MEIKQLGAGPDFFKIALIGKLDLEGENQIGEYFRSLMEDNPSNYLVDMSQVTYLASLGIRLLFMGAKSLAAAGKKLIVLNPQPMVEDTLLSSGTAKLIPIAKSEDQAKELI